MILFRRTLTKILLCGFIFNYASVYGITTDHDSSSRQSRYREPQSSIDVKEILEPSQDVQFSTAADTDKTTEFKIDDHETLNELANPNTLEHTHNCIICNITRNTQQDQYFETDTEPNTVDEKLSKNELVIHPKIIDLEDSYTICLAGYDNEIYELMNDIKTDQGTGVLIIFYVYKDSKYCYLGCSMTDVDILKSKLLKYSHYFILCMSYFDKYSKEDNTWYIDDFMIEPNTEYKKMNDLRNDQDGTVFKRFSPNIDIADVNFDDIVNIVPTFSKNEETKSNNGYIILENTNKDQDTNKYIEPNYDKENNRFELLVPKDSDLTFNPICFNHTCYNKATNINADEEVEYHDDINKTGVLKLSDKEYIDDVWVNCETENNHDGSVTNNPDTYLDIKPTEIEINNETNDDECINNVNDSINSNFGSNKFILAKNVVDTNDNLVTTTNVLSSDGSDPGLVIKSNSLDTIDEHLLEQGLSNTQNPKESLEYLPLDSSKYSGPQIIKADLQLNKPKTQNIFWTNLQPYSVKRMYGVTSPDIVSKRQINNQINLLPNVKNNNKIGNFNLNVKPISYVNSQPNFLKSQNNKYSVIWSNKDANQKNYQQLNSVAANDSNVILNTLLPPQETQLPVMSYNNDINMQAPIILPNSLKELSKDNSLSNMNPIKKPVNYNAQTIANAKFNIDPTIDHIVNKETILKKYPDAYKIAKLTQEAPLYEQSYDISNLRQMFPAIKCKIDTQGIDKPLTTTEYTNQFQPILDKTATLTIESNKDKRLNQQSSIDYISIDEYNKIVPRHNIFNKPAVKYEFSNDNVQNKPLIEIVNAYNLEPSIETPHRILANKPIDLKAILNKIPNNPIEVLDSGVSSQFDIGKPLSTIPSGFSSNDLAHSIPYTKIPISNFVLPSNSASLVRNPNLEIIKDVSEIDRKSYLNTLPTNMDFNVPKLYPSPTNYDNNTHKLKAFYTNINSDAQNAKNYKDIIQENNINPFDITQSTSPYFTMYSNLPYIKSGRKFDNFYDPSKSFLPLQPMKSFYEPYTKKSLPDVSCQSPNYGGKQWLSPTQQNNDIGVEYVEAKSTTTLPTNLKSSPYNDNYYNDIGYVLQSPFNNLPANTIEQLPLPKMDNARIPIVKSVNNELLSNTEYMKASLQQYLRPQNQNSINPYINEDKNKITSNYVDCNADIRYHNELPKIYTNTHTRPINQNKVNQYFQTPTSTSSFLSNLPKPRIFNKIIKFNDAVSNNSLLALTPNSAVINGMPLSSLPSNASPLTHEVPSLETSLESMESHVNRPITCTSPSKISQNENIETLIKSPYLLSSQNFLSNLRKPVISSEPIKSFKPVTSKYLFKRIPNTSSETLTNSAPLSTSLYDLTSPTNFYKQSVESPSLEALQTYLSNSLNTSLPETFLNSPSESMANPVSLSTLSSTNLYQQSTEPLKSFYSNLPKSAIPKEFIKYNTSMSTTPQKIYSSNVLEPIELANPIPLTTSTSYTLKSSLTNSYQQPTAILQNFLANLPMPASSNNLNPITSMPLLEKSPNTPAEMITNMIPSSTSYVPSVPKTKLYEQLVKTPTFGTFNILSNLPKPIPNESIQFNTPTASPLKTFSKIPSRTMEISNAMPLASSPYGHTTIPSPVSSSNIIYEPAIKKPLGAIQNILSNLPKPVTSDEFVKCTVPIAKTSPIETIPNIPSELLTNAVPLSASSTYSHPSPPIHSYQLPIQATLRKPQNFFSNLPKCITAESIGINPQLALPCSSNIPLNSVGVISKTSTDLSNINPLNQYTSHLTKESYLKPLQNFPVDTKSVTAKLTEMYPQINQLSSNILKNPYVLPLTPSKFYEQPIEIPYTLHQSHFHPDTASIVDNLQPNKALSYIETPTNNYLRILEKPSLLPLQSLTSVSEVNPQSSELISNNIHKPDTPRSLHSKIELPSLESLYIPISSATKPLSPNYSVSFSQPNRAAPFHYLQNVNTFQPPTPFNFNQPSIKSVDIPQYSSLLNSATVYSNIKNPYLTLSSNKMQPLKPANIPLSSPTVIHPQTVLASSINTVSIPFSLPCKPAPEQFKNLMSNERLPLIVKSNKEPFDFPYTFKSVSPHLKIDSSYSNLPKSPLSLNINQPSSESANTPYLCPENIVPLKSANIYPQLSQVISNNILENHYSVPSSILTTPTSLDTSKISLPSKFIPITSTPNQQFTSDFSVTSKPIVSPQFNLAAFYSNLKIPKPKLISSPNNDQFILDNIAPKSCIQTSIPGTNTKIANNPKYENIAPIFYNPRTISPKHLNQEFSDPTYFEESCTFSNTVSPSLGTNPIQKSLISNNLITYTNPSYLKMSPTPVFTGIPSLTLTQPSSAQSNLNLTPTSEIQIPINPTIPCGNHLTNKKYESSFIPLGTSIISPSSFSSNFKPSSAQSNLNLTPTSEIQIPINPTMTCSNYLTNKEYKSSFIPSGTSIITPSSFSSNLQPVSAQSNLNLIPTSEIPIPINPTITCGNNLTNKKYESSFIPLGTSIITPSSFSSNFQPSSAQPNISPIPITEISFSNNMKIAETLSPNVYKESLARVSQTNFDPSSVETQSSMLNTPTLSFQSPIESKQTLSPLISSQLNDIMYQGNIYSYPWQQSSVLNKQCLNYNPVINWKYPQNKYQILDNEKQNLPLSNNLVRDISKKVEADVIENLKSPETIDNCFCNHFENVTIPIANIAIAQYKPNEGENAFVMKTDDPNIYLKGWFSTLKVIKAKLILEAADAKVANFIPIVHKNYKYSLDAVQDLAKNAVSKLYGEPLVIKGVYCKEQPYAIVNNVENALSNDRLNILWPTYCNC